MKTLVLTPDFGTPLPVETALEKADRLRKVAESHFGPITSKSDQAVPRILALCKNAVPNVQPDIPLRYALSILYRLHESKSFQNPNARANMPFANAALDLRLGTLKNSIEEIMQQSPECLQSTWAVNVCMCIESIWQTEGFNQRMEVADYGDGYRIDATGIAIDLAREQHTPDASTEDYTPPMKAVDMVTNALVMLINDETTDFQGAVSCQFRAWCKKSIGLETQAYVHLVSLVASKVPLLLVRG
jgi:hypothetical protein